MDSNTSFVLNVRRETSRKLDDSGKQVYVGGFDFHIAADITWTFKNLARLYVIDMLGMWMMLCNSATLTRMRIYL